MLALPGSAWYSCWNNVPSRSGVTVAIALTRTAGNQRHTVAQATVAFGGVRGHACQANGGVGVCLAPFLSRCSALSPCRVPYLWQCSR
ncbi:hypothetical protein NPIL_692721 [Nephila pilipes]|uniref:Uncharacterized protein n=1 Tax=Nephila pilipes TaxID=299642 RepID=A0A8X6UDX7_NEPPI|nr:hypothetical protein NPIL_692721 [Nephila pilipes]